MIYGKEHIVLAFFQKIIGYLLFDDFLAVEAGNFRIHLIKIFFLPYIYLLKTLIYGDRYKKII